MTTDDSGDTTGDQHTALAVRTPIYTESPTEIVSPAVNRAAFYATFLDVYLPKDARDVDYTALYTTVPFMTNPDPALAEAMQAFALAAVGGSCHDQVLLKESAIQYGSALKTVGKALTAPGAIYNDDVLAAVTCLLSAAIHEEIGFGSDAWVRHARGAQQLLLARGPESIKSPIALMAYATAKHGSLCYSLLARKASVYDTPEWRAVGLETIMPSDLTGFYYMVARLPGLLERLDAALSDFVPSVEAVDTLLTECAEFESTLRVSSALWEAERAQDAFFVYEELPIVDFTTFARLCSDRTFTTAYAFESFATAYRWSWHWMCLHHVLMARQSLYAFRTIISPEDPTLNVDPDTLEAEIFAITLHLCKCIPFFCEPMSASSGNVAIFIPMRTAALYFKAHRNIKYLKWIMAVRGSVFVNGLAPPNVRNSPLSMTALEMAVGLKPGTMAEFG